MNPICNILLPMLGFLIQVPYNLLSGIGLTQFAGIFEGLYLAIGTLLGCPL